jgi:hypothetical protein
LRSARLNLENVGKACRSSTGECQFVRRLQLNDVELHQVLLRGVIDPWILVFQQEENEKVREDSVGVCTGGLIRLLWIADVSDWMEVPGGRLGDLHI